MPFPLVDLKRSYGRRPSLPRRLASSPGGYPGLPEVRPYLLEGKELAAQAPRLRSMVGWHEAQLGRRRREIDADELAQLAADYRLARCIRACLQGTYRFEADDFEAAVVGGDPPDRRRWTRLLERGIDSASRLRRYVYDRVAADLSGFVPPARRAETLAALAEELGLDPAQLDALLWLDAEDNERVTRVAPSPSVAALAAEYNRRALATLLVRTISAELVLPSPDGPALRRFYFLVKRNGLLCELSLVDPAAGAAGGVQVHLFGPLEVFGPRTRHGDRFARVVLALLRHFEGLRAEALVLLNEREYVLRLDGAPVADEPSDDGAIEAAAETGEPAELTELPDSTESMGVEAVGATEAPVAVVAGQAASESFDSAVEARLFDTLRGMERRGDTRGWRFLREPEPIIVDGIVLIPDFGAARDDADGEPSVFVEVIGFWTPAYRERKRAKLRQLAGHVTLVLVVQEQLRADFADLPYPLLAYKQRPSAADLVQLLCQQFDHEDSRLAAARSRLDGLLTSDDVAAGMVAEPDLRRRLRLGSTAEVTQVVAAGDPALDEWIWVPGTALCHEDWLRRLVAWCKATIEAETETGGEATLALDAMAAALRAAPLPSAALAADHLESLLRAAGFEVVWLSLFEAVVRRATSASPSRPGTTVVG